MDLWEKRRAALRSFMEANKLKATPWELASEIGEGTVRKFLNGTTARLEEPTYISLAKGASELLKKPVSVIALMQQEGTVISSPDTEGEESDFQNPLVEGVEDVISQERQKIIEAPSLPLRETMERDIPVLGTTLAGKEGDFQMANGEPIDYALRPPHLAKRKDLFAAYVQGDSMKPWKRTGQLVFVDSRPPQVGSHVMIELRPIPPDNDRLCFLKLLVKITGAKVRVAQYHPAREFEIDRNRVLKIWRVLEPEELLGL
jgi:phage repressor protein C with HTH and peptisase S24 domain